MCFFILLLPSPELPSKPGVNAVVCIYVDDILVAATSPDLREHILGFLATKYTVKDTGLLSWYLGMEITSLPDQSIVISQAAYIRSLLERFHLDQAKTMNTPMSVDIYSTHPDDQVPSKDDPYREIVFRQNRCSPE